MSEMYAVVSRMIKRDSHAVWRICSKRPPHHSQLLHNLIRTYQLVFYRIHLRYIYVFDKIRILYFVKYVFNSFVYFMKYSYICVSEKFSK